MNRGQIIHGTFVFDNITFEANYRFNGPICNQGGYKQCLAISLGKDAYGSSILGHSYFSDDKFGVEKAEIYSDKIVLHLTDVLRSRCNYSLTIQIVTLKLY